MTGLFSILLGLAAAFLLGAVFSNMIGENAIVIEETQCFSVTTEGDTTFLGFDYGKLSAKLANTSFVQESPKPGLTYWIILILGAAIILLSIGWLSKVASKE